MQPLESGRQFNFIFRSNESSSDCAELKRYCSSCGKNVIDITSLDDNQVGILLRVDPSVCIHASQKSEHIKFEHADAGGESIGPLYSCWSNNAGVPVVNTARTVHAINIAAKDGFWPLLKPVVPSDDIREKLLVFQSKAGTITVEGDFRLGGGSEQYWYNPYHSALPFAAYLIPQGLMAGERVYLPDLIEDIEESSWNQGDRFRRRSAYAIWDGKDLAIEHQQPMEFVG